MNKGLRNELLVLSALGAFLTLGLNRGRNNDRGHKHLGLALAAAAGTLFFTRKKPDSFENQSVVITGGSRGLGLALAQELILENAQVTLLARDSEELDRAKNQILKLSPHAQILTLVCDVTDLDGVKAALGTVKDHFGSVDMLINNAGSIMVGPYDKMNRKDFEAQLELHLYGVMNTVNEALPYLRKGIGRRIVNICSMGGKVAVPHMLPYDVSKFALSGYSQGLMAELAKEKISVTTVYPALMRTGSPIQAVFKGQQEKEFAWFAAADVFPGISSDASVIAKKIIASARDRRTQLIPSIPAKLRVLVSSIFPETVNALMRVLAGTMPVGGSKIRKTGYESNDFFERSPWTALLRKASRKAEDKYNQAPKDDADYNLGLKH